MTTNDDDTDFPRGIGSPARRALLAAGYTNLDALAGMTDAQLLGLHGVGPKAVGVLRDALTAKAAASGTVLPRQK